MELTSRQKRILTFVVVILGVVFIFILVVKYGIRLFIEDFDYFKPF